jgi:hypothetical protein
MRTSADERRVLLTVERDDFEKSAGPMIIRDPMGGGADEAAAVTKQADRAFRCSGTLGQGPGSESTRRGAGGIRWSLEGKGRSQLERWLRPYAPSEGWATTRQRP